MSGTVEEDGAKLSEVVQFSENEEGLKNFASLLKESAFSAFVVTRLKGIVV